MAISRDLLDELLKGCERPRDPPDDAGLMNEPGIKLTARMPSAELPTYPGGRSDGA